jgi:hypothetical protein
VLEQRRSLLHEFVEVYRQARDYKLTQDEIAILARYKNRSAVGKYLRGEASDQCVENIERILKMSPHKVDEECEIHQKRLPKLWAHIAAFSPGRR